MLPVLDTTSLGSVDVYELSDETLVVGKQTVFWLLRGFSVDSPMLDCLYSSHQTTSNYAFM